MFSVNFHILASLLEEGKKSITQGGVGFECVLNNATGEFQMALRPLAVINSCSLFNFTALQIEYFKI